MEFFGIFRFGPLVGAVGKVFVVVLTLVVVGIEQVLQVVEPNHITPFPLGARRQGYNE